MKIPCRPLDGVDLTGKILIMNESNLQPQYRTFKNLVYRAIGGFGCSPKAMGRTVFTKEVFGTLDERWQRGDFEGWMTDEEFQAYCIENNIVWEVLKSEQLSDL